MLHQDTKNPNNTGSSTSFRSLLAFKPRQVLLAHHNPTTTTTASASASINENGTKSTSIAPKMKGNLHEIILDFLLRNNFSKTLKRFQSEAQIQTDAWKVSSFHLEDMFCKHNASNVDNNNNTSKTPGNDEPMENEKLHPTKKKKKKVIISSDDYSIKDESEVIDKKRKESSKHSGQQSKDIIVNEPEKKKNNNEKVLVNEVAQQEKKKKKSSKKRKRLFSDENENDDEKKSKKKEINDQETFNKQFDGESNAKVKIDGVKSKNKPSKATMESKTVNTFQRVKIDEVEFAHDKLQDNSYWAKGGAEIGYGAKAQEVLGQVRGK